MVAPNHTQETSMFRKSRLLVALAATALLTAACTHVDSNGSSTMPAGNGENHASHDVDGHGPAMALVDLAAVTHVATASGTWSSASTWQDGVEPGDASRVHVPASITVTVDQLLPSDIKTIRVDGTLRFDPSRDTELRVGTLVTTPTGTLEVGTKESPVGPNATARIVFVDDGPIDKDWDPTLVSRGALLHGTTVIHGSEKRAFTAVMEFPKAGDLSLSLAETPTGWQPGDVVVVAGTDPSDPTSDERRTITAVEGNLVQLDAPLALDHVAPRSDLDVHVANLTRNVVFTSESTDVARRGHVMVAHTNNASIDYAWFNGLGRSDKVLGYDDHEFIDLNPHIPAQVIGGDNVRGRYSLHFHRGGSDRDSVPARVNGSVVSNDPGWGFVNHSSHVEFTNNTAYDIVGAAYYTEAGDENGSFIGNIAIRIVNPNMPLKGGPDDEELHPDARENRQDFGFQGDGMWLHSPNVKVENNVFSGISGHAVIVWPEGLLERNADGSTSKVFHDTANVPGGDLIGPPGTRMQIMDVPIGSFRGNQAYSATRGVQLFYLHTEFFGNGLHLEDCTIDPPAAYDDQLRSTFTDTTIWNVDQVGFAAPYTNRITVDGLRVVGDSTNDTTGVVVDHFMNQFGIEINDVTVEDFGTGIRINADAAVTLTGETLSNQTDVEYLIPDEDGGGQIVDGPRAVDLEDLERDNSHLETCEPGHHAPGETEESDEFEEEEADGEEVAGESEETPTPKPIAKDASGPRTQSFEPKRDSLAAWRTPDWFQDTFLGMYVHWNPGSVPGFAFLDPGERVDSGIWYGGEMYNPDSPSGVYDFHLANYGDPEQFGYHDLIELFRAENWNPADWVRLCKDAGCGFIGIGAEHGDGYPMWDTQHDSINAVTTGPRRDLLGDIFSAARAEGLKTFAAVHEHPGSLFGDALESAAPDSHLRDPRYADLYQADTPEVYEAKLYELVGEYRPDQLWIDNPILQSDEQAWMRFVADYYTQAESWGNGGALIAQKDTSAFLHEHTTFDIEGGEFPGGVWEWRGMSEPFPVRWQKDVPLGNYWQYAEGVGARPTNMLIDGIVDRVAKNGVTLLSLAPMADGTLPAEQVRALEELAGWMAINREALEAASAAPYSPGGVDVWQANDGRVRFTEKGAYLYAIDLGNTWPPTVGFSDYEKSTPPAAPYRLPGVTPAAGSQITMLGSDQPLSWHMDGDELVIEQLPDSLPGDFAWTFKIRVSS